MLSKPLVLASVAALIFAGALVVLHRRAPASAAAPQAVYDREIRPILARHCLACHGARKTKAKLNLELFPDEGSVLAARKTWKKIYDQVQSREMPPEDRPKMSAPELEKLTTWIEAALDRPRPGQPRDPGRVVLRRLNRVEYRQTIRDLVGVDFNPAAEDFPSDDVGYGFDNIGDVLSLPPLLLEKYLSAAEKILDRALVSEEARRPPSRRFDAQTLKRSGGVSADGDALTMFGNGEGVQAVEIATGGRYLLRVRASGEQAGRDPARMALKVDEQPVATVDVAATRKAPKLYEESLLLAAGTRRIAAAFVNDYYDPTAPPSARDRNLFIDFLELVGPIDARPAELPESHRRIVVAMPGPSLGKRAAAAEVVGRFARLAFRRPVASAELEKLLGLFDLADRHGDAFETALKLPLQAVLVSPQFLFRVERGGEGLRRLDDWEIASRLSYFLWSTMPDAALFEAAATGALRSPEGIDAQVRRMLKDPKARALAENFAVQWLQLRRLETHAPDPKKFPSWDEALRSAMHDEALLLFDEVVREDRDVVELIGARHTYLNERLARHYGIEGVTGPAMRKVELSDPRRGGVLLMGAVLTVTSNPTRTAAVKRGKWVLETILGTPPPPPLPDAGELKDETEEDRRKSLRERLEKHRADPSCANCHKKMDPLGFGFENYDPIGAWRERDGAHPVESSARLPDGSAFDGPVALKALLLSRRDDFVKCLAEKLLTFALGRGVEYYDQATIQEIRRALAERGYRFSVLATEIAKSYPFLHRRDRAGGSDEVKDD